MDVPGIVAEALDGEEVAARVDLGGDDVLLVTPTRTLIYRSEGLLSDESVETYDHDAERLAVSEGRRKVKLTLTYPVEGTEEFTIPGGNAEAAISAVLAGVLHANNVLEPGESVLETFRFSELTLVVTSHRLVKHVGGAVWDEEYEEYRYEDVTSMGEEAGSVATQIVLTVDGRPIRIKTPNDRAPEVERRLEEALREYHDVGEREDLNVALAPEEDDDDEPATPDTAGGGMSFEDGVAPLDAGDTSDTTSVDLDEPVAETDDGQPAGRNARDDAGRDAGEGSTRAQRGDAAETGASKTATDRTSTESTDDGGATSRVEAGDSATSAGDGAASPGDAASTDDGRDDPFERSGFESAADGTGAVEAELAELREQLEEQNRLLARQQQTIEQLVEELRRGR